MVIVWGFYVIKGYLCFICYGWFVDMGDVGFELMCNVKGVMCVMVVNCGG